MEGKNNQNYSKAFGQFSDPGAFSQRGNNINEPKNITSDMWTPISVGNTTQAPQSASAASKKASNQRTAERKTEPASKGKGEANKASTQTKKTPSQKKKAKAEPKKAKSRTPQGKPVSQKKAEENKKRNKQSPKKKDNIKNKKTADELRRQENERRAREKQELNKNNRDYEEQARQGKSHNEISRKRAAVKQKQRRLRNIAAALVFFIFIGAFVSVYTYSKGAPVQNIILEGETVYTQDQITAAAGIIQGINMLSLKEKTINTAVTSALPYIHSVEIKRKLPDTVTIIVTPTAEKYLIVNGTGQICVDEYDKILSLKKHRVEEGKYRIYGFEKQEAAEGVPYEPTENNKAKYELVKNIVSCMEKEGVITQATINVTDVNDVKILYNKVMIYLGDCKKLESQISLAGDVIKEAVTAGQTGYIDMRYSDMAFFNEGTMNPG